MSYKETHETYERIANQKEPLRDPDFGINFSDEYIPYPVMKNLIYAFTAACSEDIGIEDAFVEGMRPSNTDAWVLHHLLHEESGLHAFTNIGKSTEYARHLSLQGQARTFVMNKDGLFDEYTYGLGETFAEIHRQRHEKLAQNITFAEAVGQFCSYALKNTVILNYTVIDQKLAAEDWKFIFLESLLKHESASDDSLVTRLLNEHKDSADQKYISEKMIATGIANTEWGNEYISLLMRQEQIALLNHIHLIFPTDGKQKYPHALVIRRVLREHLLKDLRTHDVKEMLTMGTATAKDTCVVALKHTAQALYLADCLQDEVFLQSLESQAAAAGIDLQTYSAHLVTAVSQLRECKPPEKNRSGKITIEDQIKTLIWKSIAQKAENDPGFVNYVYKAIPHISGTALQYATEVQETYADRGLTELKTHHTGFEPGIFQSSHHHYHDHILAPFTSKIVPQGCIHVHTGLTKQFIHIYQDLLKKALPIAQEQGAIII